MCSKPPSTPVHLYPSRFPGIRLKCVARRGRTGNAMPGSEYEILQKHVLNRQYYTIYLYCNSIFPLKRNNNILNNNRYKVTKMYLFFIYIIFVIWNFFLTQTTILYHERKINGFRELAFTALLIWKIICITFKNVKYLGIKY